MLTVGGRIVHNNGTMFFNCFLNIFKSNKANAVNLRMAFTKTCLVGLLSLSVPTFRFSPRPYDRLGPDYSDDDDHDASHVAIS